LCVLVSMCVGVSVWLVGVVSVWQAEASACHTDTTPTSHTETPTRIPIDVLRRAMSSVHDRLADCEQRNGGHLEDVTSGMMCWGFFFCSVLCFKTTDSLISANAKVCTSLQM